MQLRVKQVRQNVCNHRQSEVQNTTGPSIVHPALRAYQVLYSFISTIPRVYDVLSANLLIETPPVLCVSCHARRQCAQSAMAVYGAQT
jgi:hypothetical protein